ncbi:replicative DNA helicase [bacterium]|nr:MAG: replicative DNA helicase [bacterium]
MAEDTRTLPQAIEAEQAVLGAMILYPALTERGLELLSADMFYTKAHKVIFNRIEQLALDSKPIDTVTLNEALSSYGELETAGGAEYIAQLVESVVTPAHFDEHANLVEHKALLRKVVELCTITIDKAYRAPGDARIFVDSVESEFYRISEHRLKGDFVPLHSVAKAVQDKVETLQKSKSLVTGIATGYYDLDKLLSGFHPSDYIVIAGRTSSGKTAFALSLARNIAIRADKKDRRGVAIFSLEMSREQVALRMLATEAKISAHRMRQGFLKKDELTNLALKVKRVANAPIYIDDSPNLTVMEMKSKARRLSRRVDIGVIIVDYLQLVTPSGTRADTRQEEVASISRALKGLAREIDATVIALAQLSRKVEETKDSRPKLSHLRESGAIEQDADVVLLLYRPEVHQIDKIWVAGEQMDSEGLAELIVAKQRNGPTGSVYFAFDKESISFEPYMYKKGFDEMESVPPDAESDEHLEPYRAEGIVEDLGGV